MKRKSQSGMGFVVLFLAVCCIGILFMNHIRTKVRAENSSEREVLEATGIKISEDVSRPEAVIDGVEKRMEQLTGKMNDRAAKLEGED